ncbi:hypothetical protein TRICHSKD4_3038 [Roseibium sp. TrichSKD4]|uniref:hypothetical protein n=1 Tax=Roseibium sp. TrichSKD4 TaxID=744980 RepID=UPI0001E56B1C|nr:hypothetical protein [Roseibium sp. TrichSKD4]EFO31943.1 hypothetical protein TRICHSKD4_3038 [Roseibium sp. TrichSKD4]
MAWIKKRKNLRFPNHEDHAGEEFQANAGNRRQFSRNIDPESELNRSKHEEDYREFVAVEEELDRFFRSRNRKLHSSDETLSLDEGHQPALIEHSRRKYSKNYPRRRQNEPNEYERIVENSYGQRKFRSAPRVARRQVSAEEERSENLDYSDPDVQLGREAALNHYRELGRRVQILQDSQNQYPERSAQVISLNLDQDGWRTRSKQKAYPTTAGQATRSSKRGGVAFDEALENLEIGYEEILGRLDEMSDAVVGQNLQPTAGFEHRRPKIDRSEKVGAQSLMVLAERIAEIADQMERVLHFAARSEVFQNPDRQNAVEYERYERESAQSSWQLEMILTRLENLEAATYGAQQEASRFRRRVQNGNQLIQSRNARVCRCC